LNGLWEQTGVGQHIKNIAVESEKTIYLATGTAQRTIPLAVPNAQRAEEALLDAMLYSSALKELLSGKW
jgi:hypothetical protein